MNNYEMTFIVRPDLDDEGTQQAVRQVTERVESGGAELIASYLWNPARRRMAYQIRDFDDGVYVTTTFKAEPDVLKDLDNAFKLNDRVLRHLLVRATDQDVTQSQQRAQQQEAGAPVEQEAAPPAPTAEEPPTARVEVTESEAEAQSVDEAPPEGADETEVEGASEAEELPVETPVGPEEAVAGAAPEEEEKPVTQASTGEAKE